MKTPRFGLTVLVLFCATAEAQSELTVPRSLVHETPGGDPVVSFCLLTNQQTECTQPFAVRVICCNAANEAVVKDTDLCLAIQEQLPYQSGVVVAQRQPQHRLWRLSCQDPKAPRLKQMANQPPVTAVPPASKAPKPVPAEVAVGSSKPAAPNVWREKLDERLAGLERAVKAVEAKTQALEEERKLRVAMDAEIERRLEALRQELTAKIGALEQAQKNACVRQDGRLGERPEVLIAVAGGVLRFLEVKPASSLVALGLSQAKADEWLEEEAARTGQRLFPGHLYRAVPERTANVEPFFLQDRLIDSGLYSRILGSRNARRVAYDDARRFVVELNRRCQGKARFDLPSEEQFVAAAHRTYRPLEQGLMDCAMVAERSGEITQLFGDAWQLTRSPCSSFSANSRTSCDRDTYIRKGGSPSSRDNRLECLPEYRHPGPADIELPETSFRLVLEQ
jgi:hypothetical protein